MPTLPFSLPPALLWALAASLALAVVPGGKYALYPCRILGTWVHECCHALAALMMGGQVTRITLAADTSGLTHYRVPTSRLRQAFVASAGYVGTSLAGAALFLATQWAQSSRHGEQHTRWLVAGLAGGLLFTLLIWIRNAFGALSVAGLAGALLGWLYWPVTTRYSAALLSFLSLQISLGALYDIRTLYRLDARSQSDAHAVAGLLWLPAWFWATLWLGLSAGITGALAYGTSRGDACLIFRHLF